MRSCLDYYVNQAKDDHGIYYVIDSENKTFPVFCKFRTSKGRVYNLILSYKWDNLFNQSLTNGAIANEDNPMDTPYRLSTPKMENIRKHFKRWRIVFKKKILNDNSCRIIVDVDFHHELKRCESCLVHIYQKKNNEDKKIHESKCNFTHAANSHCKGLLHNFGSYCCLETNNISNYCPPNSETIIKTWLTDDPK